MGKQEKKIELVKQYLPRCNSVYPCHTYGRIPTDKFKNACMSYAGHVEYENALGLIDETVFGSGKKGMLFTDKGVYTSDIDGIIRYADGRCFNSLSSSYNLTEVNELLEKLYEVENTPTGWDIAGSLLGGLFTDVVSAILEPDETTDSQASHEAIEDKAGEMPYNIEDDEAAMEEVDDEDIEEMIASSQKWVETLETVVSDALVCQKESFSEGLAKILEKLENSKAYEIETFIDTYNQTENEDDSDVPIINFAKNSKKIVNKMKYYMSMLEDLEDPKEVDEEIAEAKRVLRKYAKILNTVSEKLEEM